MEFETTVRATNMIPGMKLTVYYRTRTALKDPNLDEQKSTSEQYTHPPLQTH